MRSNYEVEQRGCHHIRCSTSRMEKVRDGTCECFKSGKIETVQHTMLHCPAFAKDRKGFPGRAYAVQPGFDAMPRLKQAEMMLGSNSRKLLNPYVYRYLMLFFTHASTSCEFRLCRGKGCGLVGFLDPAFILGTASENYQFYLFIYLRNVLDRSSEHFRVAVFILPLDTTQASGMAQPRKPVTGR